MPKGEDGQYELILETRQVLVIFLFAVVLCGVFFGLGFVVGRHSSGPTGTQVTAISALSSGVDKKQSALSPETPAAPASDTTPGADAPPPVETPAAAPETKAPETKAPETKLPEKPVEKPRVEIEKQPDKPKPAFVESTPKHAETPPPVPASVANGPIVLQVSAHGKREDADPVVALLKRKGFPASIVTVGSDPLYHVQVGPYSTMPEAEAAKKSLEEQGFKPYLKK